MKGGSPYIYNILTAKKLIPNFTILEQPLDVGFWVGCGWLTPGSCQAPTELLPQHHPQGKRREGKRARKLLDQGEVCWRSEWKTQVKQRAWLGPSLRQLPSHPWTTSILDAKPSFSSFYPSFYCSSQSTGIWATVLATNPKHSTRQAATK